MAARRTPPATRSSPTTSSRASCGGWSPPARPKTWLRASQFLGDSKDKTCSQQALDGLAEGLQRPADRAAGRLGDESTPSCRRKPTPEIKRLAEPARRQLPRRAGHRTRALAVARRCQASRRRARRGRRGSSRSLKPPKRCCRSCDSCSSRERTCASCASRPLAALAGLRSAQVSPKRFSPAGRAYPPRSASSWSTCSRGRKDWASTCSTPSARGRCRAPT